jgi:hypothetical protein
MAPFNLWRDVLRALVPAINSILGLCVASVRLRTPLAAVIETAVRQPESIEGKTPEGRAIRGETRCLASDCRLYGAGFFCAISGSVLCFARRTTASKIS